MSFRISLAPDESRPREPEFIANRELKTPIHTLCTIKHIDDIQKTHVDTPNYQRIKPGWAEFKTCNADEDKDEEENECKNIREAGSHPSSIPNLQYGKCFAELSTQRVEQDGKSKKMSQILPETSANKKKSAASVYDENRINDCGRRNK